MGFGGVRWGGMGGKVGYGNESDHAIADEGCGRHCPLSGFPAFREVPACLLPVCLVRAGNYQPEHGVESRLCVCACTRASAGVFVCLIYLFLYMHVLELCIFMHFCVYIVGCIDIHSSRRKVEIKVQDQLPVSHH